MYQHTMSTRSSGGLDANLHVPAATTAKRGATTSTPFHDANLPSIVDHSNINSYIISPANISNVARNTGQQVPNKQPPMISVVEPHDALLSDERIISYQKVKRIVTSVDLNKEAELKNKELYLEQLKSIDLSKFSFPNENKPKTDYTYARTSSYLNVRKDLATDNIDMPNLCRRSRLSPHNSFNASTSITGGTSYTSLFNKSSSHSGGGSPVHLSTINLADDSQLLNSPANLSIRNKVQTFMKGLFSGSPVAHVHEPPQPITQRLLNTTTTITSTKTTTDSSSIYSNLKIRPFDDTNKAGKLQRNLNPEYEGINEPRTSKSSSILSSTLAGSSTTEGVRTRSRAKSQQKTVNGGSEKAGITSQFTMASTYMAIDEDNNKFNESRDSEVQVNMSREKSSGSVCCNRLAWLILLLLIPFCIYGLNKVDEQHGIYKKINQDFVEKYWGVEANQELWNKLKGWSYACQDNLVYFFTVYVPDKFSVDSIIDKTYDISRKAADYFTQEFEPSVTGGHDITHNVLQLDREAMMKEMNDMKEKLISETLRRLDVGDHNVLSDAKNKLSETKDYMEIVRQEFDQKFNYTVAQLYNKMADKLLEVKETAKQTYASEKNQLKGVIDEIESRYKSVIDQLQDRIRALEDAHERQKYSAPAQTPEAVVSSHQQMESSIREALSDENVSFKKIEEYINKTLYRYNADKTGMTDFASESIGGSILFTRCTESYTVNSRWLTVFDVPITPIHVTPRVVIQGSIQPGNCWAFKGSKGDLFIKLAAAIVPKSFSIEHIPKELSLTGLIDSAPQNFTVYGYVNKDDITDEKRLLLGNYRYDNESINTLQFFEAQHTYESKPIAVIELKIESNSGNKDYTCLYKFRVHGSLYRETKRSTSDDSEQQKPAGEESVLKKVVETVTNKINGENS